MVGGGGRGDGALCDLLEYLTKVHEGCHLMAGVI
jgi:hypothetical protein